MAFLIEPICSVLHTYYNLYYKFVQYPCFFYLLHTLVYIEYRICNKYQYGLTIG